MNKSLDPRDKATGTGKSTLLLRSSRDPQLKAPKDIMKQVGQLQKFFADNKTAYLNVVNYLPTKKTMTETERIAIDTDAEKVIALCTTMIADYRHMINKQRLTPQSVEHYNNVVDSVDRYLRRVSREYTETKAIRVKKVIEMHKISKLETIIAKEQQQQQKQPTAKSTLRLPVVSSPTQEFGKDVVSTLSPEEMQMFETENDMMYTELNSLSQEVKEMESKVVHIAELQDQFTHNVLEQEKNIDRIANIVQATTDDMRDANEQIRQAIQRNAGLRVWVLFFLLVMSFSLIFLDWYND